MVTGASIWTTTPGFVPTVALNGGGAIYTSDDGSLSTAHGSDGTPTDMGPAAFADYSVLGESAAPLMMEGSAAIGVSVDDGSVEQVVVPVNYIDTFSAFPMISGGPNKTNAPPIFNENYNAIEIATSASATDVWNQYLTTYLGVVLGTVASIVIAPDPAAVREVSDTITFSLKNPFAALFQGPFSVQVTRFDSAADALAAVTIPPEHPLVGARYWRVFPTSPGHLVIETGAVDRPDDVSPLHQYGFWIMLHSQLQIWREELQNIVSQLGAQIVPESPYDLVEGAWNARPSNTTMSPKLYVLTQICGHAPTPAGFCR
jgi:hypothetical protein